jgi:uncharacterized protein (DUF2237 family)
MVCCLPSLSHREMESELQTNGGDVAVFKQPLSLHSTSPMTGFLRNGYCEVPSSDFGNHAVAAEVVRLHSKPLSNP